MKTAEKIASSNKVDIPDGFLERVLEGVREENYREACEAKSLFDNFLAHTDERRPAPAASD